MVGCLCAAARAITADRCGFTSVRPCYANPPRTRAPVMMFDQPRAERDVRLQRLRAELDAIDTRIVEALADRLRVVGVIGAFKETQPDQIRDRRREEEVLQHLQALARDLRLD